MNWHTQGTSVGLVDTKRRRKYLTSSERRCFLEQAYAADLPDKLLALALAFTGARPSELVRIRKRDLHPDRPLVLIKTLKRRSDTAHRELPIPHHVWRALQAYTQANRPSARIWPICRSTVHRRISTLMSQADLQGIAATPRGLRHTFAVHAVLSNIPLTLIQKWMGHADIATTSIYAAIVGEEEIALARRMWREQSLPHDLAQLGADADG